MRAGLGLTILPSGYVSTADRDLVARPLYGPSLSREVLLVTRGAGQLATPRAARSFCELLGVAADIE